MTYGSVPPRPPFGPPPGWHGARYGREDIRPQVKQYGNFEDAEDEQVDPKIVEAEARKSEEQSRERGGRSAVSMRWTPENGFERVTLAHPPEPPASAKRAQTSADEAGFDGMQFQDPPPPSSSINLGLADIPNGWPAGPNWTTTDSSPYRPPTTLPPPPPPAPWPTRGASW